MAQKFNFRIRHLMFTGFDKYKYLMNWKDFPILQKFALILLCSCVIYSRLAVFVVLASIKHLELCKSYLKSQNKIGFNTYILYDFYRFTMFS